MTFLNKLALALCIAVAPASLAQVDAAKPNVILILADDLGYGDLGCYGNMGGETPHLDRMAADGARFTDFTTTFPACAPSRTSLLTGRYHFRSGMFRNPAPDVPGERGELIDGYGIPDEAQLLPEALWASGYTTGMIGKWHLGHHPRFFPTRHGFESYFGILYSNDMRPVQVMEDEQVAEDPAVQSTLTARYTERACSFIESNQSRPFFLYLAHAMPHKPLAASEEFYTPDTPDDLYADVVRELDDSVGQVLGKLDELKLAERTLVIFTSDNGPWFGGSTGGLRGMKASPFEGGLRVPLIVRWPGEVPAGQLCIQPCSMVDLFPTVLSRCATIPPISNAMDGRHLWDILKDPAAPPPHQAIFALAGDRLATVRSGKWKLHLRRPSPGPMAYVDQGADWTDPRAPDGETILGPAEQPDPTQHPGLIRTDDLADLMLFDLEADPGEETNLADSHPEVVEQLQKLAAPMAAEIGAARAEFLKPAAE